VPDAYAESAIDVALNLKTQPYSRNIFGHFIEHFHTQVYGGIFDSASDLSDAKGYRVDVIEAMREMRPPVVRWPGGCFVSSYHWLDGVGPDRRSHYDKAWRVCDPNTFGTREFVEWCEAIGAAPYICTNAGTGSAEEMSDWLEYCNLPNGSRWADLRSAHGSSDPLAVPFWSIGNENYGHWEIGAKTPDEWSSVVRESAKMMRRVDESVTLLAAARSDLEWTLPMLLNAGDYLDLVSIHGYWDRLSQVNEPSSYLTAIGQSLAPQEEIQRTASIIGATGLASKVGIAFDEWNLRGWHHPDGTSTTAIQARDKNDDNSTYTMADALFSASFLNSCLRKSDIVRMANIAPSVNTRGPLFVHRDGVVRRPTFHVMSMYSSLLGSDVVETSGSSRGLEGTGVPAIDVLATTDPARTRLNLALINRDPARSVSCHARVQGHSISGTYEATILQGGSSDSFNDVRHPSAVVPQQAKAVFSDGQTTLPPHSLTICDIDLPFRYSDGIVDGVSGQGRAWDLSSNGWARTTGSSRWAPHHPSVGLLTDDLPCPAAIGPPMLDNG